MKTKAERAAAGKPIVVGVISDTHGLVREVALNALRGVDHIIHAGDIGESSVLDALGALAPTTAVRGNNDHGAWASRIPETAVLELGGLAIYILHNLAELDLDPAAAGFRAVVVGHSHKPNQEERSGVLYFNPGSAGPRRFRLPIAIGRLVIERAGLRSEILMLE